MSRLGVAEVPALALALLLGGATAPVAAQAATGAPPAGRYAGEFCVTLPQQNASCGAADAEILRSQTRVLVRIADIVYQLTLRSSQLDVVLLHGAMQIDGFVAPYEWRADGALQFDDVDKRTRYALKLGERQR